MTTQLPDLVTVTGVDDRTDLGELERLSRLYPVEWGVLLSPSRQGRAPRYPDDWRRTALRYAFRNAGGREPVRFSLHLCGAASRAVLSGTYDPVLATHLFQRVQLNYPGHWWERWTDAADLLLGRHPHLEVVIQYRGEEFPDRTPPPRAAWLHDPSGGRGEIPDRRPAHPATFGPAYRVGYAGGISPENVLEVIEGIQAPDGSRYWIDLESGARDASDWLDLDRVRMLLEKVYGAR